MEEPAHESRHRRRSAPAAYRSTAPRAPRPRRRYLPPFAEPDSRPAPTAAPQEAQAFPQGPDHVARAATHAGHTRVARWSPPARGEAVRVVATFLFRRLPRVASVVHVQPRSARRHPAARTTRATSRRCSDPETSSPPRRIHRYLRVLSSTFRKAETARAYIAARGRRQAPGSQADAEAIPGVR